MLALIGGSPTDRVDEMLPRNQDNARVARSCGIWLSVIGYPCASLTFGTSRLRGLGRPGVAPSTGACLASACY